MKIKECCLVLISLLAPAGAHANSDFNISWSVNGIDGVSSIDLDLNEGTQYLTANGAIHTSSDLALPVTGTCLYTNQDGANCRLLIGNGLTVLLAVQPSLSGTWRTLDESGQAIETGTVTLDKIR